MNSDEFEKAFCTFLENDAYDHAENALFSIVRLAFSAGWLSATRQLQQPENKTKPTP